MNKQEIIHALQEKKAMGMNSKQAALAVWNEMKLNQMRLTKEVGIPPLCLIFSESLIEVFDSITPVELAITLKALGFSDDEVAVGLYEGITKEGGNISAIDLATVLLNEEIFPQTTRERMKVLLYMCKYSEAIINDALKRLYPLLFNVQSTKPWQDTGITIGNNEIALIEASNDRWYISPGTGYVDANGTRAYIGKQGYALPGAPEGALIARINGKAVLAGKRYETLANQSGKLELCPNDDLNGWYGAGLMDNIGSISVKITVRKR